ncbi:hypothetical protein [Ensifer canadensis]
MIEFVILPDSPDATALEFCRAYIGYDCATARYAPEVRHYTAEQIASFERKAVSMKDPESGDVFKVAPLHISEKIKERDDAGAIIKRHIGAYLAHPLRFVIAKEIQRRAA